MPTCPKCRDVELVHPEGRASRLLRCPTCRGTWFPKDEARLEAAGALMGNDSTLRPGGGDGRTGLCPHGHGILIRARVDAEPAFFLERCPVCHGIWFDKGEWNALAQSHLLDRLDDLWNPAFRFQQRSVLEPTELRAQLGEQISEPLMAQVDVLGTALRERSPREQNAILAYLRGQVFDVD